MRIATRIILAVTVIAVALLAYALAEARRDPVVRTTIVALPGYPAGAPPLTIMLLSDIHVAGPDMPPARVTRIVRQVNALHPDLVMIAGDLVSDKTVATRHYPMAEAVAPLAGLRPRLTTIAVLGNHDHWYDRGRAAGEARVALRAAGIVVLDNRVIQIGPIRVMGLDDAFTHHADLALARASLAGTHGPIVALTHTPDLFPKLPEAGLVLAGHTHCGQVRLPLIGAAVTMSSLGKRYACGRIDEAGRTLIVGAGLGTSGLPIRLGAPPDLWLVTIRAPANAAARPDGHVR